MNKFHKTMSSMKIIFVFFFATYCRVPYDECVNIPSQLPTLIEYVMSSRIFVL